MIVELDGQWVLSHREDEILPIAAIESELKAFDVFECDESSLTSLCILFDENKIGAEEAKSKIESVFLEKYPRENIREILSVQIEDHEESFEDLVFGSGGVSIARKRDLGYCRRDQTDRYL